MLQQFDATVSEIDAGDVVALRGDVVVVDVRGRVEFEAGHAPGALAVSLPEIEAGWCGVDARLPFAVVCRSGDDATRGAALLRRAGRDAFAVRGGMRAWVAQRCPIVCNVGRPPAII